MKSPASEKRKATRKAIGQRTRAVYFRTLRELRLVQQAAARVGVPWSAFMREACVARAEEVLGEVA